MNLLRLAAELFLQNTGNTALNLDKVMAALKPLLGGAGGDIDLAGLLERFQGAGLARAAASWLGDGGNDGIDKDQVLDALGEDAVAEFGQALEMEKDDAARGLAGMIPELIDKTSRGGSVLEQFSAMGGALGLAGKLFR